MKIKIEIEKLIVKDLLGDSTASEKEQLGEWLKDSPRHQEVLNRLRTAIFFSERYEAYKRIDSADPWRRFRRRYCPAPLIHISTIRISTILKYAAILLLPIVLGVGAWYLSPSAEQQAYDHLAPGDAIQPGTPQAVLTLSEKSEHALSPAHSSPVQITPSTAAIIQNGTLIYPASSSNTGKEEGRSSKPIDNNTLTTNQGNEFRVVFEDGTTVHLNYNTEIRYPIHFGNVRRIVYLKGEAYFKIAKDSRPFYVVTDGGTIKQYGTEFNVNTFTPQHTEVALVKGSISITPKGGTKEHLIHPGQLAYTHHDKDSVAIQEVDLTPYIAWNEGRLIFENRTLQSIAEILERWYNVNITFGSAELKRLHFTGNMDRYGTISPILQAIARTTNLRIQIEDRNILITEY